MPRIQNPRLFNYMRRWQSGRLRVAVNHVVKRGGSNPSRRTKYMAGLDYADAYRYYVPEWIEENAISHVYAQMVKLVDTVA